MNAMDALGKDIRATEDTLNKERSGIQKLMERLKDYKPGTEDFKKLEEVIAQKQADFSVKAQIQKREFQDREAALYYKTLQEINEAVKYFAEQKGIGLVMKFNSEPMDPSDRDSVMRELNKPVMFQSGINITDIILAELNRGATPVPGSNKNSNGGVASPQGGPPSGVRTASPPRNPQR